MKKNTFILSLFALSAIMPAMAKTDDKTIMTVAGEKVPVSEFEYFYHKNNSQQAQPMTPEEYAELFAVYKLKVADAKATRVDTSAVFKAEFDTYRRELILPYLRDRQLEDSLVNVAYNHLLTNRNVSHIMLPKGDTPEEAQKSRATLDSLRISILNGADFKDTASRHSIDIASARKGGNMGFIPSGRLPYSFEEAAYDTPVGELSGIIETPFGFHLLKIEAERPDPGEVLAKHILLMTQGKSDQEKASVKSMIDSIHTLAVAGEDFDSLAVKFSEDYGSASQGGQLPWFGSGMMVPEFEAMSFSLKDGEISKPFETSYGYHIIKRLDHRGVAPLEEKREALLEGMKRDGRYSLPEKAGFDKLKRQFGAAIYNTEMDGLKSEILKKGHLDNAMRKALVASPVALGEVNKQKITTRDILKAPLPVDTIPANDATAYIDNLLETEIEERLLDAETAVLLATDTDFRNLYTEYRDGMMLFEVANREVWGKAAADEEGLNRYFEQNRDQFKWDAPKFKGYVVYSLNDSVGEEFVNYLMAGNPTIDSIAAAIENRFNKQIRMERILAGKGDDKVVDTVIFNSGNSMNKGRWMYETTYQGRLIEAPEEMADVRGAVVAAYQNLLEENWVKRLKERYPVKIDKKILKSIK